jgi:hypothetical protein
MNEQFAAQYGYIFYRLIGILAISTSFPIPQVEKFKLTRCFSRFARLMDRHAQQVVPDYSDVLPLTEGLCNLLFTLADTDYMAYIHIAPIVHKSLFKEDETTIILSTVMGEEFVVSLKLVLSEYFSTLENIFEPTSAAATVKPLTVKKACQLAIEYCDMIHSHLIRLR